MGSCGYYSECYTSDLFVVVKFPVVRKGEGGFGCLAHSSTKEYLRLS